MTKTREPGELRSGNIVSGLNTGAAQSVHLLRGLEMGRAFRILARKEFRADHGWLSLLIADHPQPRLFAIRLCHHTRLEARACSRGSGDMQAASQ